jgi:TonB family protein
MMPIPADCSAPSGITMRHRFNLSSHSSLFSAFAEYAGSAALTGLAILLALGLHDAKAAAADAQAKIDVQSCPKPEWPREALRAEHTGRVTIEYRIDANGAVLESQVKVSSGYPLLDEAARVGLMRCAFQPAVVQGRSQASWMEVQYVWTLEDDEADPKAVAAFEAVRAGAQQGNVEAQRELGLRYHSGNGVERNLPEALKWLEKAGNAGDAEAQWRVARYYAGLDGVPYNLPLALEWLGKAARQGRPEAQMLLGMHYLGAAETRDDRLGLEWLRKSAAQDFGPAYAILADLTHEGRAGLKADPAEAIRLLRKAAELDDTDSQMSLGAELLMADSFKEQEEALRWLHKAAARGDRETQAMLGMAYVEGRGVAVDDKQARNWYGKAAAQSWPAAQFALAAMTEKGMGGPVNKIEALALYQRAAANGYSLAAQRLAQAFDTGDLGDTIDKGRAAEWRRKALELAAAEQEAERQESAGRQAEAPAGK